MDHRDVWVDGDLLATAAVGGSEGHRRLRELRKEGYDIRERRHPEPGRDVWQYKLVTEEPKPSGVRRDFIDEFGHAVQTAMVTPMLDKKYARGRCPLCRKTRLFTRLTVPVYSDTVEL